MQVSKPVLAVLPLRIVNGTEADVAFAEDFVESLVGELARFSAMEVIAPQSSRVVADLADTEAAARLGATHLLRGRFQRDNGRLRIAANLVDGESSSQLWSEKLEASEGTLFDLQDELVARVAATLTVRLEDTVLKRARRKPLESLAAHELTLRGLGLLRRGSFEADEQARQLFEQALELDPQFARAHAGLSLSWFNEWGCQLWNRIHENGQAAYEHAHRALDLDDTDAMMHVVIGRILLYRREYERASWYLDRALALCPNDSDMLLQLAVAEVFLGRPEIGIERGTQALRLNPYHPNGYYAYAAFPYFTARKLEDFLEMNGKAVDTPLICAPAHTAIANAYLGRMNEAQFSLEMFYEKFKRLITDGRTFTPDEACTWLLNYAPYRRQEDRDFVAEGFRMLVGDSAGVPSPVSRQQGVEHGVRAAARKHGEPSMRSSDTVLVRDGAGWRVMFEGVQTTLPDLKGLHDLAQLLGRPGKEFHCLDLTGREDADSGEPVLDERGRQEVKRRIRELQEELAEAEDMNDVGRAEKLRCEMDRLVEEISRALGIGGRGRRMGDLAERARSTVTWRIRHAIRRIGKTHPDFQRHLENSIRTGVFCSYQPEKPRHWKIVA